MEKGKINVLSLFDGMACGMLAFKSLGIQVENYYAYEIDKYAVQTATHNFPDIQELGDVFNADFSQHNDIDWLVGGGVHVPIGALLNRQIKEKQRQAVWAGNYSADM